jgi:signal transduction histidine kinase
VVFVGMTAQSAARDRLMTPLSSASMMPGVEIHASGFETLAGGRYLRPSGEATVLGVSLLVAALAGLVFWKGSGARAYVAAGALLLAVHALPIVLFTRDAVFPYFAPVSAAWLSLVAAAAYQHFVVRRRLVKSESDVSRYQQAMHFVTHELKTPLTAIQGSSELISRYNMNDDKRKQMALLINTESKRLARMIETFLNVERLTAGQMELRREAIAMSDLVNACLERARPLADRKQITLQPAIPSEPVERIEGDRELMEYAVYNLVNNAIKYSPPDTVVRVRATRNGDDVHLTVADQGIGMDQSEMRNLFQKFYRTRRAEASGEKGTGIGLSIVQQIISHHGGRIEVASEPGKGSQFTVILPAASHVPARSSTSPRS